MAQEKYKMALKWKTNGPQNSSIKTVSMQKVANNKHIQ